MSKYGRSILIIADTTDEVTLSVKGVAAQTANLLEVKKSDDTTVLAVSSAGIINAYAPFFFQSLRSLISIFSWIRISKLKFNKYLFNSS